MLPVVGLLLVIAGAPGAAAGPLTWGGEITIQLDRSTNAYVPDDRRRMFPPSGSVAAEIRWQGPARIALVSGMGYEQWVRTEYILFAMPFTGIPFEALGQVRERSIVLPLALELPMERGWIVAPGVQWRHVFAGATRLKSVKASFGGEIREYSEHTWSPYEPPVRDRWSATLGVLRVWNGEAGTRSLGLRWVHGLTDVQSDPGVEEWHRSLQLVLGWSR